GALHGPGAGARRGDGADHARRGRLSNLCTRRYVALGVVPGRLHARALRNTPRRRVPARASSAPPSSAFVAPSRVRPPPPRPPAPRSLVQTFPNSRVAPSPRACARGSVGLSAKIVGTARGGDNAPG